MEDNIQEMYDGAKGVSGSRVLAPGESRRDGASRGLGALCRDDVRHKLGHMAVDESGIGNYEDKFNKINNKTLGTL